MFWLCEKNGARAKKRNEGGGGEEGRKETLADKPLDFENPVRQQMNLVIGWA